MLSWVLVTMHMDPTGTVPSVLKWLTSNDQWWNKGSQVREKVATGFKHFPGGFFCSPSLPYSKPISVRGVKQLCCHVKLWLMTVLPGYPFQFLLWLFPVVPCQAHMFGCKRLQSWKKSLATTATMVAARARHSSEQMSPQPWLWMLI